MKKLIILFPFTSSDILYRLASVAESASDVLVIDEKLPDIFPDNTDRVFFVPQKSIGLSNSMASFVEKSLDLGPYDIILSDSSPESNSVLPLLAFNCNAECISDAVSVSKSADSVSFTKYVYGMNLCCDYTFSVKRIFATVCADRFPVHAGDISAEALQVSFLEYAENEEFFSNLRFIKECREDLSNAARVIIAGRGAGSRAEVEKIKEISKLLNCEVGATRPLVQQALAPYSSLVGASGSVLKAEKCLVMGASGMAAFSYGIRQCGKVISVNCDSDAAVFEESDYGVIGDCNIIADEMLRILKGE